MLTSKLRAELKALAHHKDPVILVGKKGLTEPLVEETRRALLAHELIKVRFLEGGDLEEPALELATRAGAEVVAIRGHIVILFAPHPEKPRTRIAKLDRNARPTRASSDEAAPARVASSTKKPGPAGADAKGGGASSADRASKKAGKKPGKKKKPLARAPRDRTRRRSKGATGARRR